MDIRCPLCGEPWDHDELHEYASYDGVSYKTMWSKFRREGCGAFGARCNSRIDEEAVAIMLASMEVNGDDVDGIASDISDWLG